MIYGQASKLGMARSWPYLRRRAGGSLARSSFLGQGGSITRLARVLERSSFVNLRLPVPFYQGVHMNEELANKLVLSLEAMHDQFQRREATAWLVVCWDEENPYEAENTFVGAYGPFASPEEALVELVKHDESSAEGFKNAIIPLYPPVKWRDES